MSSLSLPANLSPDLSWWYHEDASGISEAASRWQARALAGDFSSGLLAERVSEFRSGLIFRSWVCAGLAGTAGVGGVAEGPGPLVIQPEYPDAPTSERAHAIRCLAGTPLALARAVPGFDTWTPPRLMVTGRPETAFPPLVIVAIVAVSAAAASVALAYCSNQAAQVVDHYLAREQAAKELLRVDAQALALVDRHVAREKEAGAALPLDAATVAVLGTLETRQKALLEERKTPPVASHAPEMPSWGWPAIAAGVLGIALFLK